MVFKCYNTQLADNRKVQNNMNKTVGSVTSSGGNFRNIKIITLQVTIR